MQMYLSLQATWIRRRVNSEKATSCASGAMRSILWMRWRWTTPRSSTWNAVSPM